MGTGHESPRLSFGKEWAACAAERVERKKQRNERGGHRRKKTIKYGRLCLPRLRPEEPKTGVEKRRRKDEDQTVGYGSKSL